jgi:fructokinase
MTQAIRIGVDLGGTKIEAVAIDPTGAVLWRERCPTPSSAAEHIFDAIAALVKQCETAITPTQPATVGIGTPGSISPKTGLLRGSNTIVLNGQNVVQAMHQRLQREVRVANDANCFALSEATDGAGKGAASVFGVILGTGCGAGVVINGKIHDGPHGIAGEWGHNPLPWPQADEFPPLVNSPRLACYCGKQGCIETWISGTGIGKQFADGSIKAKDIVARAGSGDAAADAYLHRVEDRIARALAVVINILDPHLIVLGGGASNITRFYDNVPKLLSKYVFSDHVETPIVQNVHGDSSGVRGAAWLW